MNESVRQLNTYLLLHSNKTLTILQGYPWRISSIGKPRPTSTGIHYLPSRPIKNKTLTRNMISCIFQLNCKANAANLKWNSVFIRSIRRESVVDSTGISHGTEMQIISNLFEMIIII